MDREHGGVWEEALAEEMVYLVGHLAHAEQHLLEIETALGEPMLIGLVDRLRDARKKTGQTLYRVLGLSGEGGGGEFRSPAESLWCTLKHLAMALIHCDENIEKIGKRLRDDPKLAEELKTLYETRRTIRDTLMDVIFALPKTIEFNADAVRCREDLCEEAEITEESTLNT